MHKREKAAQKHIATQPHETNDYPLKVSDQRWRLWENTCIFSATFTGSDIEAI